MAWGEVTVALQKKKTMLLVSRKISSSSSSSSFLLRKFLNSSKRFTKHVMGSEGVG